MASSATGQSASNGSEAGTQAALVQQHLPLVYQVAWQVKRRIGDHVTVEELISAGTLGLIGAVERFDPLRGRALSTYAIPRIRGAMLDDLRERDWVPRRVRRRMRAMTVAARRVEQREGRAARPADVAGELDIPLDGYWRWVDEAEGEILPLQATEPGIEGEGTRTRQLADRSHPTPDENLVANERNQRLQGAIAQLPPRMKQVLTLTYHEELGGRAIAALTGVSESRISQLKHIALRQLRETLLSDPRL